MSTTIVYVTTNANDTNAQVNNSENPFTLTGALRAISEGDQKSTLYLANGTYTINQAVTLPPNVSIIGTDKSRVILEIPTLNIRGGLTSLKNLTWNTGSAVRNENQGPLNMAPDSNLDVADVNINTIADKFSTNGRKIRFTNVNLMIASSGQRTAVINLSNSNAVVISNSQFKVLLTSPITKPVSIFGNYGPGTSSIENSSVDIGSTPNNVQAAAPVPIVIFDGVNVDTVTVTWKGNSSQSLILAGGGTDQEGQKDLTINNVTLNASGFANQNVYRYYNSGRNIINLNNITWGLPFTPAPFSLQNLPGMSAPGVTRPCPVGVTGPRGQRFPFPQGVTGPYPGPIGATAPNRQSQNQGSAVIPPLISPDTQGRQLNNENLQIIYNDGYPYTYPYIYPYDYYNYYYSPNRYYYYYGGYSPGGRYYGDGHRGLSPHRHRDFRGKRRYDLKDEKKINGLANGDQITYIKVTPDNQVIYGENHSANAQSIYHVNHDDYKLSCNAEKGPVNILLPDDYPENTPIQITREDKSNNDVQIFGNNCKIEGHKRLHLRSCDCHKNVNLKRNDNTWVIVS